MLCAASGQAHSWGRGQRALQRALLVSGCFPDKQPTLVTFPFTSKGHNDFYQCEPIFTSCILPKNDVLRKKKIPFFI